MLTKEQWLERLGPTYGVTEIDQWLEAQLNNMEQKWLEHPILEKLAFIVIQGRLEEAIPSTQEALDKGFQPLVVIYDGLAAGMKVVGDWFRERVYFLPEVLLSATAMQNALSIVLPLLQKMATEKRGTVIIGTVEGDIHDIGKSIVKALLTAAGYTVHDLGRDVAVDDFIEKAKEHDAQIIAMSTLMTPTLESMRAVEERLKEAGLKDKVRTIVGGGSVTPEFAQSIGSDAYGKDASEAVKRVNGLVEQIMMALKEIGDAKARS
jgi:corrinoid protein of di/trimethylamine methyltransferase